jgi:LysM repeat protein
VRRRRRRPGFSIWTFVAPAALVVAIVIAVGVLSGATGKDAPAGTVTNGSGAVSSSTTPKGGTTVGGSRKRKYYRVKAGDTFDAIEKRFSLDPGALTDLNPSVDPLRIQPGDRLRVR